MGVRLKFQSSGAVPGNGTPVVMNGPSLTVGRGAGCDLVLPDPDQQLSRNHCVIEDHNGNVVVVDLSANGTFLNYAKIPLGRTPTPLNNGDVLCVGNYELVVEIVETAAADPLDLAPAAMPAASPGVAEHAPDPLALLDDVGPGGDFLDDLLGEGPTGPSQLKPADPIDDLLPPMGEEEDPFFTKPQDGREGEGASLPHHAPSAADSFHAPGATSSVIPDDWDDEFLSGVGDAPQTEPAHAVEPDPVAPPEPAPLPVAEEEPATPEAEQPAPPAPTQAHADAMAAILQGLGAEDLNIAPEDQHNTFLRMGRVMKTLITGLREILMTRTTIKSEFRIEQTMISAGGNNPLKFSITPEQAIEAMVRPTTKGYLSPESAAHQALEDIKAHEVAMVTGMEAALKGVLARLDPKSLEAQFEQRGRMSGLLRGKKAQYWDVYEKLYAEISDQAENDFHELFSREFAKAYQAQLDRLKT
ncbi:type VI secretion system-associated FHA domain protein TagH [Epibacterium sp. SM1979]|uniref:Type VI secretion system-associated FHA domain protein TagH n=1 Tax=Tritonibacter litoralis TaxID=2662264 RepID=A0A843YLN6_9RHOB|nr:type VI secretion system-associated FHA domain protein TagH [Tritonibacter litoralis]MQQ10113.1 type VI secretion system-associated FHA domain protein TagH [Tritonibacter litoralis]